MRSDRTRYLTIAMASTALMLLVASSGCQRSVAESSVVDTHADVAAELDYWDKVAVRRVVTNNDALHGLLLVADNTAPATWEERLAAAQAHGWIDADASLDPNTSAEMGMMAVAACDVLKIKGGVTMRLLGPSPRYCVKELVFHRVIPARSTNQALSGLEFVDFVGRVEDYRDTRVAGQ